MNWKNLSKRLNILSLAAGLTLTVLNIGYFYLTPKKTTAEITKMDLESTLLKNKLNELKPKYDVYFVEMSFSAYNSVMMKGADIDNKPSFYKFSIHSNEIHNQVLKDDLGEAFVKIKHYGLTKKNYIGSDVVVLAIQQTGGHVAKNVRLVSDKIDIPSSRSLDIFADNDIFKENLEKSLEINKGSQVTIQLGDMNSGSGILVPLFIRSRFSSKTNMIGLVTNTLYVPRKILFVDEFDGKETVISVRKMLDHGLIISADVVIRG